MSQNESSLFKLMIKVHLSNQTTLVCHRVAFLALPSSTYTQLIQQRTPPAIPYNMLMFPPCANIQNQKKFKKCIEELESDLETVSLWSSNNSLVFNDDKTKSTLFSTTQLSHTHNLNNNELFKVMHCGKEIYRAHTKKILGIHFAENLSWSYHVKKSLSV